eukprot:scaffold3235_cov83-Cylindrotheca_fusiformis.AAC.4
MSQEQQQQQQHQEADDDDDEREVMRKLLLLSKTPEIAAAASSSVLLETNNRLSNNITKLDLFQAGLSSLPECLPKYLPNLSILFCMKNQFQEVPKVIGECPKLQMISFKSNQITTIHPDALQCQLRWLILTDNQIAMIPKTIGRCTRLQKCMLSGNCLRSLPAEIVNCHKLELIRLASNQLQDPPMELLQCLPNLSWIAFSDNPFLQGAFDKIDDDKTLYHLDIIPDDNLDDPSLGIELGKGASGITRRYTTTTQLLPSSFSNTNKKIGPYDVAVKEYFANITSDGNPQEERKVSMVASSLSSSCKSLIQVLGRTKKGNLVMELLQDYRVFANPPNMESCSRDVYDDEDEDISDVQAIAMVEELLHALDQLHQHGICHGDFYGHNILVSTKNNNNKNDDTTRHQVWLTDFGAAFFYDPHSIYGPYIQRVERRAFGHLLTEIVALLQPTKSSLSLTSTTKDRITELASCCETMTFSELYKKWTAMDF